MAENDSPHKPPGAQWEPSLSQDKYKDLLRRVNNFTVLRELQRLADAGEIHYFAEDSEVTEEKGYDDVDMHVASGLTITHRVSIAPTDNILRDPEQLEDWGLGLLEPLFPKPKPGQKSEGIADDRFEMLSYVSLPRSANVEDTEAYPFLDIAQLIGTRSVTITTQRHKFQGPTDELLVAGVDIGEQESTQTIEEEIESRLIVGFLPNEAMAQLARDHRPNI